MVDRRSLLKSGLLSLTPVVPGFLARTASSARPAIEDRVLVVLQLDGGNDGINTVVPFGDEAYAKNRRELRLATEKLCKVGEGLGLHPSLRPLADLLEAGRLAIVQGVGYPNPNRSHFESMATWQTALPGVRGVADPGWLGRSLDLEMAGVPPKGDPAAFHVGDENVPRALSARRAVTVSFADSSDFSSTLPHRTSEPPGRPRPMKDDLAAFVSRTVNSAYLTAARLEATADRGPDPSARYPATELARRLALVARSIKAGARARVYYVIQPGYDTHAVQAPAHARLLRELAGAIRSFLDDLTDSRLAERVLLMTFSEFGRRPEENGSFGTDHGTAGPMFVTGAGVKAGLIGKTPLLGDLEQGDLRWSTDFRRVYASILSRWMDIAPERVLGGTFPDVDLLG